MQLQFPVTRTEDSTPDSIKEELLNSLTQLFSYAGGRGEDAALGAGAPTVVVPSSDGSRK